MSEEELAIWRAAYAAAFVQNYNEMHHKFRDGLSAEWAVSVADLAVARLREFRTSERIDAGIQLSVYHLRKE